MNEEMLLALTDAVVEPESLTNPEQRLQELTPEIAEKATVVNTARPQGRLQGVTNFLANPEVQMALASFGRAFADNQPGEAGTILADFTEKMITSRGNEAALQAAESGGNIAEAGGQFASPELVQTLQQNRELVNLRQQALDLDEQQLAQQAEQFEVETGFKERITSLREVGQEADIALQTAAQLMDSTQFNRRADLLEQEAALNERVQEKQMEYTDFLMGRGADVNENFALRTNEFLEVLSEQEQVMKDDLENVADMIDDVSALWFNRGTGSEAVQQGVRAVEGAGLPTPDPARRDQTREALQSLYQRKQSKLSGVRTQIENLQRAQTARLGGSTPGEGDITDEQAELEAQNRPTPIKVTNARAGRQQPIGSVVELNGIVYERAADRLRRLGTVEEYGATTQTEE